MTTKERSLWRMTFKILRKKGRSRLKMRRKEEKTRVHGTIPPLQALEWWKILLSLRRPCGCAPEEEFHVISCLNGYHLPGSKNPFDTMIHQYPVQKIPPSSLPS